MATYFHSEIAKPLSQQKGQEATNPIGGPTLQLLVQIPTLRPHSDVDTSTRNERNPTQIFLSTSSIQDTRWNFIHHVDCSSRIHSGLFIQIRLRRICLPQHPLLAALRDPLPQLSTSSRHATLDADRFLSAPSSPLPVVAMLTHPPGSVRQP